MKFNKIYDFFFDPGHGWLKVPKSELVALGIVDKISSYSYLRGDYAYLEEDCDASLFITERRKYEDVHPMKFRERSSNKSSKIRSYQFYNLLSFKY